MGESLVLPVGGVLLVTSALVPVALTVLRRFGVLDHPSRRSSHSRPTPRGGGIAPAAALVAIAGFSALSGHLPGTTVLWAGVLLTGAGFAALGLLEDVIGVAPLPRFCGQLLAATCGAGWLAGAVPGGGAAGALAVLLVVLWLTTYANCFNFMDGINGISAVSVVLTGIAWYVVGRIEGATVLGAGGLLVAAAALGFLPYNFPRARVFLGDAGSYFFGAVLGSLVVVGAAEGVRPEALLAPLLLPAADTGSTLMRRIVRGEPWHAAHRDHVYQRLVRLGWSHGRTTAVFGALLALSAALGLVAASGDPPVRVGADTAAVLVAVTYLLTPRLAARGRPDDAPATPRADTGLAVPQGRPW